MFKFLLILSFASISLQLAFAGFKEECLNKHNEFRAKHSAPPLKLDNEIQAWAQQWANHLASTGSFNHRPNNKYGENLYAMFGSTSINGATAVQAWYNEIKDYNWNNPGFTMQTGHFTQVVWKNSQKLGCAKAQSGRNVYVVANYSPPGNYRGQFQQNVLRN